ncbi:unnamed protein product, partial [Prunus brigantina]
VELVNLSALIFVPTVRTTQAWPFFDKLVQEKFMVQVAFNVVAQPFFCRLTSSQLSKSTLNFNLGKRAFTRVKGFQIG